MVMCNNHPCAVDTQSISEQLSYSYYSGIETALVNRGHLYHSIFGVQEQQSQVLLLQQAHLDHNEVCRVRWTADLRAFFDRFDHTASALNPQRSSNQKSSDPCCPAQSPETL